MSGRVQVRPWRCAAWLLVPLLAACAQLPRPAPGQDAAELRSGRLALTVQDQPGQSFSAAFELRGQPQAGQLTLLNPLGGTVAVLRWQPGQAVLESPGNAPQQHTSIDALLERAAGAAIPVSALFDWLSGVPTAVPGWEPDLSQLADGRLRAQRRDPPPLADLRIVLDR
jgi:outer membrane lipoprotein LolB